MAFNEQETSPVFIHNVNTVGAVAESLAANDRKLYKGIVLKAAISNTGTILVGFNADAATSAGAFPLHAGDALTLAVSDASRVFVSATEEGQLVYFIGS